MKRAKNILVFILNIKYNLNWIRNTEDFSAKLFNCVPSVSVVFVQGSRCSVSL